MSDFYADRLFNALERNEVAPGMLLVSAPDMESEDFVRSVILVVRASPTIVFGVNLAARTGIAVANALPTWTEVAAQPQELYMGGPSGQDMVMGLGITKVGVNADSGLAVNRLANRIVHVDLSASPEDMKEGLVGVRFFIGFAEWSTRELQSEIDSGDWYVAPALPSDILAPANVDVWGEVLRRQAMPLPLYSTFPEDPRDN